MNQVRQIDCICGNWEEMPADKARYDTDAFTHKRDLANGEAYYYCDECGAEVISDTVEQENGITVLSDTVPLTHRYTENDGCLIQRTGWANYEGVTVSIVGKNVLTPVTFELTHEQADMLKAVL